MATSSARECSLCSGVIDVGGVHNAAPLAHEPCCDSCNTKVIEARISAVVYGLKQPGPRLNRQIGELKVPKFCR